MAYTDIELFKSKLDWAMPFQRTGKFPLDRTSIFDSYADALKYAKGDGSDERALGGTSYVGQLIIVNGAGSDGSTPEVAAYVIGAVGSGASLIKLAQTTSSGDLAGDVSKLQSQVGQLVSDVDALEALLGSSDQEGLRKDIKESKEKLAGIENGAQVNVIEHISVNGIDQSVVEGKKVELTDVASKATLEGVQGEVSTLKQKVEDLQGATVYVGDSTTDPIGESGPTVEGVEEFKKGDIVSFGNKEYLFNGTAWREFGDEGSHITRGEVAEKYVAKTTTVNGKALDKDITLAAGDVGAYGKSEVDDKLANYATTEKLNEAVKDAVKYQTFQRENDEAPRKTIQLANHDTLSGVGTDGQGYNIAMVSKWDKVDLGTTSLPINLNGKDARPTYNDDKEIALLEDVPSVVNLATKQEVEQVKQSIPSIEGLATKQELTEAVENAGKIKKITAAGEELTINEQGVVDIPKATAEKYGLVKLASGEFEIGEDGTATIKEVNAIKLKVNEGDTLIINGGDAAK